MTWRHFTPANPSTSFSTPSTRRMWCTWQIQPAERNISWPMSAKSTQVWPLLTLFSQIFLVRNNLCLNQSFCKVLQKLIVFLSDPSCSYLIEQRHAQQGCRTALDLRTVPGHCSSGRVSHFGRSQPTSADGAGRPGQSVACRHLSRLRRGPSR